MDVQLDRRLFTLRADYNTRMDTWTLDLIDGDGERLLSGARVVKDYPLLPGWRDERFPQGQLFAVSPSSQVNNDPCRDAFTGEQPRFRLVYVEPEE
jgi:hypothetical protein